MQLNELDKKTLIELKDSIADIERRVEEVATIRVKADTPLEVLLEQTSYKRVWDKTYREAQLQAEAMLIEKDKNCEILVLEEKRLTYSSILESGKTYEQAGEGIIGLFALKIMDGKGLFEFVTKWHGVSTTHCTFTAIPEEKYVLFGRGLIASKNALFEVKEIEGHIQYVLAMSAFLDYKIEEVT
jgi:hypothetical protein